MKFIHEQLNFGRWLRNCILAVSFFLVVAVVGEIFLIVTGHAASYSAIYEFDDQLGYRLSEGHHRFPIAGRQYEVSVDAEGVVDRYGDGNAEILLLGDGVVAGLEYPPNNRLSSLIGNCSRKSTVNLAVPGYGTVQQLISLQNWLNRHEVPEVVMVFHNLSNDYYDNVQNWEGSRIPGIVETVQGYEIVKPENPSWLGRVLRRFIWNSRLYSYFNQLHLGEKVGVVYDMPNQQKWLYSNTPPVEAKLGDDALRIASSMLINLSEKYKFELRWYVWKDFGKEEAQNLDGDTALKRVSSLIGISENQIKVLNDNVGSLGTPSWETEWLHPGNRHASLRAMKNITNTVADNVFGEAACF